ncbi:MAG: TIGR04255 family protein [Bryobacteraceae bacterium]
MTASENAQPTRQFVGFPASPRVIYAKNPLISVACQIRFAPVLRIESEVPAAFQELIRSDYPLLRETSATPENFPAEIPPPVAAMIKAQLGAQHNRRRFDFISQDEHWTTTLLRDSLTVSTRQYDNWGNFKARLNQSLTALNEIYRPAFFTRIGLRYQDLIRRHKLDLSAVPWRELLQPRISGFLIEPDLSVVVSQGEFAVKFGKESGQVQVRHGLVQSTDKNTDAHEECYLIDSDFFLEGKISTDGALESLDFFNVQSGRLFRWCITERLHVAMEPTQS